VEWAVPIEPSATPDAGEWGGLPRTLEVLVEGTKVRVTRPEYTLVRSAERNAAARVTSVLALLRTVGLDGALLRSLVATSSLDPSQREALLRSSEV
jgi:hypothetical protein